MNKVQQLPKTYQCDLHQRLIIKGESCPDCKNEADDAIARAVTMSNAERIAIFERFITTEILSIEIELMGALLSTLMGRQIALWEAGERNHPNLVAEIKAQPSRPETTKTYHDFLNVMPPSFN